MIMNVIHKTTAEHFDSEYFCSYVDFCLCRVGPGSDFHGVVANNPEAGTCHDCTCLEAGAIEAGAVMTGAGLKSTNLAASIGTEV